MKTLLIIFIFFSFSALHSQIKDQIVPKNWWSDSSFLEQAEYSIQKELDTGVGMNATAWDMASVRDARLFIIYVHLFQNLNQEDRAKLFKEQSNWLKMRSREVNKLDDPNGGSAVTLDKAGRYMDITNARIKELQKRLKKMLK